MWFRHKHNKVCCCCLEYIMDSWCRMKGIEKKYRSIIISNYVKICMIDPWGKPLPCKPFQSGFSTCPCDLSWPFMRFVLQRVCSRDHVLLRESVIGWISPKNKDGEISGHAANRWMRSYLSPFGTRTQPFLVKIYPSKFDKSSSNDVGIYQTLWAYKYHVVSMPCQNAARRSKRRRPEAKPPVGLPVGARPPQPCPRAPCSTAGPVASPVTNIRAGQRRAPALPVATPRAAATSQRAPPSISLSVL
jgi:hypothetical protein